MMGKVYYCNFDGNNYKNYEFGKKIYTGKIRATTRNFAPEGWVECEILDAVNFVELNFNFEVIQRGLQPERLSGWYFPIECLSEI